MNQKTVLLVDDEPTILVVLSRRFRAAGFQIRYAADGQKALEMIERVKPDLVILDLMLPKLPGLEVCRAVKDAEDRGLAAIPIIVLTAKKEASDRALTKACGADAYMAKPFDGSRLMRLAKEFTESSASSPSEEFSF